MHLLAAQPGGVVGANEAVDLGQTPGDIVFASAADTELSCVAAAYAENSQFKFTLRLANLMQLSHNLSVDIWVEQVIQHAKIVVIRVLGGTSYWPYGVERLSNICQERGILLALLPGDDKPDSDLTNLSTLTLNKVDSLWRYLVHGGKDNALGFLQYSSHLIGKSEKFMDPIPLPRAGYYYPIQNKNTLPIAEKIFEDWQKGRPAVAILFYRALVQAGDTNPIDALIKALQNNKLNVLPIFVSSLRDTPAAAFVETAIGSVNPDLIISACAFSVSTPGATRKSFLASCDAPILQIAFSGQTSKVWFESNGGLGSRDIAMHVALPEVDGRIFTRAVAFKTEKKRDENTQTSIVSWHALNDRINFVAKLAASWTDLRLTPVKSRNIALVLANYPNRNDRIGNGVGLDSPASTISILNTMRDAGYNTGNFPTSGQELIEELIDGITNDHSKNTIEKCSEKISLQDYKNLFSELPEDVQSEIEKRWGKAEKDPFFRQEENGGYFMVPVRQFEKVCVIIQPARGYNIDPIKSYHDPALIPPHGYFAVYFWARKIFSAHALIHVGKHGNLEWLPGKSLALSEHCYPEAVLGPIPNIYPFIVNDPGEGSQAKRRTHAVIIDHLTPPLTRAGSYGPLQELETLVDEYFEASHMDTRRLKPLADNILSLAEALRLDKDCGILPRDNVGTALSKLDGYLCEIKELQIRDGLHIFGKSPVESKRNDFLLALARIPRGGREADSSITRALSQDLFLNFDPLDCDMSASWNGPKPAILKLEQGNWRTNGDTIERLEYLAQRLISEKISPNKEWHRTGAVLEEIKTRIAPDLDASGGQELKGILNALDGRFVNPGPSGAPSRGRPEVLPTGRNFYSVDTRSIPTQAAWLLGWKSAQRLCEQYAQDHGEWPRCMALTAWGTSSMRTGGDDIAQAMALIGTRPTWDQSTGRVTGFEILPADLLDRPRVDITLRISGFFRDAFPGLVSLFDSATRAIASLSESISVNPHAHQVRKDAEAIQSSGVDKVTAIKKAGYRIFGSMPGAYGAGLQSLIDENIWNDSHDLAKAYITWGGWAYGANPEGVPEHDLFKNRLGSVQAIIQNQDNREHDLLDSDDYYQFEGGLAAAVSHIQGGKSPAIYHNDHTNPENPRIYSLSHEISRVIRGRAANPKWIKGIMQHGYKGAFEMAATLDYLFAFAATTNVVENHHFEQLFNAYIDDEVVRNFIYETNPTALIEMVKRFEEAVERELWQPLNNHYGEIIEEIMTASKGGNGK